MTTQMFSIDNTELKRLEKFFLAAPRKAAVATGMMLNKFAFGTREKAINLLPQKMTIRSEAFMKSRLKVIKSRMSAPINNQQSEIGSVPKARFSGWAEQETGIDTKRTRLATISGRLGAESKKIPRKFRMGRKFESPEYFPGGSPHQRAVTMLQMLGRQDFPSPFLLFGHSRAKSGLYMFDSGELKMLINLDSENLQPKRIRWLSESRELFFASANMHKLWGDALKRVLKFK